MESYEQWLAGCSGVKDSRPPMFLSFKLRGLELSNRVVVSPMAQYCATDGVSLSRLSVLRETGESPSVRLARVSLGRVRTKSRSFVVATRSLLSD